MKNKSSLRFLWLLAVLNGLTLISQSKYALAQTSQKGRADKVVANHFTADEFVGPFPSWANLKRDYGAIGNGKTDDTEALQKALNELKQDNKPKVLYIPAGTYRITRGLTMVSTKDISVVGQDPTTTIIRWDGEKDGIMLDCNGVSYSRFGRITWDGVGKAATAINHGWDGKVPFANTNGEHTDEVFKDVAFGIKGGSRGFMDAECVVLRCQFIRCSKAGISLHNFNAADWLVWYSTFQDCSMGVTNTFGAGYYSVNHCLFRNSKEADIAMGNCGYFSMRHNTSIQSKAFFTANWASCGGLVTIQGNTILDPTGPTAIQVGNLGPCLLVDNVIRRSRDKQKGERLVHINLPETALAVGNTFPVGDAIEIAKKGYASVPEINTKVIPLEKLNVTIPSIPKTAARAKRKIVEVPAGATAQVIQEMINNAAKLRGKHPVVHFPPGQYQLDQTLVVPANADVQLIGDGYRTMLAWVGKGEGPILKLSGPSRAILKEMQIMGNGQVEGVVVENCDQPGARVFMQQGNTKGNGKGSKGIGLLADGLDHTDVSLHNFYHSGCKEVGVKVVGGPLRSAGKEVGGRVAIFGGASSNNALSYDVINNANLLVEDVWYEGSPPRFIHFTEKSSGTFTLNGAKTATGRPAPDAAATDPNFAALEVNGFRGKMTLINVLIGTNLTIGEETKDASIFCMTHGTETYFTNRSKQAKTALFNSVKYLPGGGATPIPSQGQAKDEFILDMLAQLRKEVPRSIEPIKRGLTDMRVYRVMTNNCTIGWHLKP